MDPTTAKHDIRSIAGLFHIYGDFREAAPYGTGHTNDTKLNNVMIDDATGKGICVIDLDTVMPGLALYDFGDLCRSGTRPTVEDERDLSKVEMRQDLFEALVRGYLASAGVLSGLFFDPHSARPTPGRS